MLYFNKQINRGEKVLKKILFIGDVVGEAGCDFLRSKLRNIKQEYKIDITIVNGENSAQGNGITPNSADALINAGADVITTGNHVFRRREIYPFLDSSDYIIRPANFPEGGAYGKGVCTLDMGSYSVAVVNLMGTAYMEPLDNPFTKIDAILEDISTPNIFLDFHAEATSEKKAMGHYLTGKVTGVFGTHTHVQTADEAILGGHTAYITDAGMTGVENSCLGVESQIIIDKFRFHMPAKFKEAEGNCILNGVVVGFDEKSGKAMSIERIIIH
ncbi:MAG: TIGR00282 family metallophosphoesterase [Ruminococcus sp.]|nr:TIGR00282 family metallophosphoesterase [Ruminococcus sp.]